MTAAERDRQANQSPAAEWKHAHRADLEHQAADERARFLAERPGYEFCPQHPERAVVDSGVCTLRHCAECVESHRMGYVDAERLPWDDDHRMSGGQLYTRAAEGWRTQDQPKVERK